MLVKFDRKRWRGAQGRIRFQYRRTRQLQREPGPVSLYSGTIPAFDLLAADEPSEPSYTITAGTQVTLTITGIDAGTTAMKIGTTQLAAVGDSVVLGTVPFPHTHPEYQLQLTLAEGEYGEGRISFRLSASGPTTYAQSEIYTLKISNRALAVARLRHQRVRQ